MKHICEKGLAMAPDVATANVGAACSGGTPIRLPRLGPSTLGLIVSLLPTCRTALLWDQDRGVGNLVYRLYIS